MSLGVSFSQDWGSGTCLFCYYVVSTSGPAHVDIMQLTLAHVDFITSFLQIST